MKTIKQIISRIPSNIWLQGYLLVLGSSLLSSACLAQDVPSISETRISDRVTVYSIDGQQSTNITSIETGEGYIIIDSETSPVFARAIRTRIEESNPGGKFRYLINTHDHGDHTYGNQAFPEAVIIGHERCREDMIKNEKRAGQTSIQLTGVLKSLNMRLEKLDKDSDAAAGIRKMIAYYEPIAEGLGEGFVLTPPDIVFSDRISLSLGGVNLALVYFGHSHSASDIIISCPEEKLIVTGDLFYEGSEPYFDSERIPYIERSIETLQHLIADTSLIQYVIPGHGPMVRSSLLADNLEVMKVRREQFEGRESAFLEFRRAYEENGLEAAIEKMKVLFTEPEEYYFLHPEFDSYAFRLMMEDKLTDAKEVFTLLAEFFPDSYIAYDSLGEVCLRLEEAENAKRHFGRSLELNPENENARNRLAGMK